MHTILGVKHSKNIPDSAWRIVQANPFDYISEEELDEFVGRAVRRIEKAQKDIGPRLFVGWSGGKDSQVLYHLALAQLGIRDGFIIVVEPTFEFTTFVDFLAKHTPPGVIRTDRGLSWDWLRKNPTAFWPGRVGREKSFSKDSTTGMSMNWRAQRLFFKKYNLDAVLLGRRTIDGNHVGNGEGFNRSKDGYTVVNPIYDWPHEAVFAYMAKHDLKLPAFYAIEGGFKLGGVAWPLASREDTMRLEPSILTKYSAQIEEILSLSPERRSKIVGSGRGLTPK